ncbi:TlpA family protein disulfide reductase, partial [Mesorhizobium sp. M7A.F.Ca.CA.002.04.1.1]
MADGSRFFPAPRLILAALVAGALAGAVAVYVSESRSGNNAPAQAAVGESKDDVACAAKSDRAKKVAASATGEVAALLPADPPQSLKSLAFNGPDGKPMTIADHAGKTVLLNQWGT